MSFNTANVGGNIVPNQMNPLQQPLPPHPSQTNQQPGPLQSMPVISTVVMEVTHAFLLHLNIY